jgi:predicted phosphodiesterase
MKVAALDDIHGNLPAPEAVLEEIGQAGVDQIVGGGDVVPGPMPRETLARLLALDKPVRFIQGNGELAMLALAATDGSAVTYWGTTSGTPPPEACLPVYSWTAQQLEPDFAPVLARWPKEVRLGIGGLGPVLFCHSTPRSETEVFTRSTPDERLVPIMEGLGVSVVVCGHTHMQFDRQVGRTRVVNAGSVGAPYGAPEAAWLLLGPGIELRQTSYDLVKAAERIRATEYPQVEEFIQGMSHPPSEREMLELFGRWELT